MKTRIIPILALAFLVSCNDQDLQKVAKSLLVTADAVGVVQTTVIEANTLALIPDADTRAVLGVCKQVNLAGKDAVRITRDLSKLGPTERTQLLEILKPVIAAVRASQALPGITDPATREKVRTLLLAVETALNSTQLILAATGR